MKEGLGVLCISKDLLVTTSVLKQLQILLATDN